MEEFGLLEAAKELGKKVLFFDKEEIDEVEELSEESEFVREQIGVGAVSEPCAYLASFKNGNFIAKKIKHNGVTVSIYEEEFGYE
jgi:cobalt-precorrin 5A hydrolase